MNEFTLIDLESGKLLYFNNKEDLMEHIKDILRGIVDIDIQMILNNDILVFKGHLTKINLSAIKEWNIVLGE